MVLSLVAGDLQSIEPFAAAREGRKLPVKAK
jgi:hypothetical protein